MSMKLPVVSGIEAIKALQKVGYIVVSQKGSHIKMHNSSTGKTTIVPRHSEVSKTTLKFILKQTGLTAEEFSNLL